MRKTYLGVIPNTHVRDFQRKKVYDAEEQCAFWQEGLKHPLLSSEEVAVLVKNISEWASIKQPDILYEPSHAFPIAYATADLLVLPFKRASSLPYICHEMAHVVNYNSTKEDHHGRNFTHTYLQIVKKFIGVLASRELKQAFKVQRVKYVRA